MKIQGYEITEEVSYLRDTVTYGVIDIETRRRVGEILKYYQNDGKGKIAGYGAVDVEDFVDVNCDIRPPSYGPCSPDSCEYPSAAAARRATLAWLSAKLKIKKVQMEKLGLDLQAQAEEEQQQFYQCHVGSISRKEVKFLQRIKAKASKMAALEYALRQRIENPHS